MRKNRFGLGQLRHLYKQMLENGIVNQPEAARYLLAPGIKELEELYRDIDAQDDLCPDCAAMEHSICPLVDGCRCCRRTMEGHQV